MVLTKDRRGLFWFLAGELEPRSLETGRVSPWRLFPLESSLAGLVAILHGGGLKAYGQVGNEKEAERWPSQGYTVYQLFLSEQEGPRHFQHPAGQISNQPMNKPQSLGAAMDLDTVQELEMPSIISQCWEAIRSPGCAFISGVD